MRMRKKPNLQPRMEKCAAVQIAEPAALRGKWRESFPGKSLWLEIGCGKGRFTVGTAKENPGAELIALEKVEDAMVIAMERACAEEIGNVRFISMDALKLREVFAPGEVERIFLNFCDPWPKSRDAKHRLTSPNFLRIYADILPMGGEVCFKTDNLPLFTWSLEQIKAEGEAEYMRILADAYNTPEKQDFYNFTRALDAVKVSLNGNDVTIILGKDSALADALLRP